MLALKLEERDDMLERSRVSYNELDEELGKTRQERDIVIEKAALKEEELITAKSTI